MAEDTFIDDDMEVMFVQRDPEEGFKRRDDDVYVRRITKLIEQPKGTEAQIKVVTGEIKRGAKQFNGRGKNELAEAKTYQRVANDLGYGLKVSPRYLTDGFTVLRMMIVPKREFTEEQVKNREAGQNRRRLELARVKLGKAQAALQLNANDEEAKASATEAAARIKELDAKLNGKATAPKKQSAPAQ